MHLAHAGKALTAVAMIAVLLPPSASAAGPAGPVTESGIYAVDLDAYAELYGINSGEARRDAELEFKAPDAEAQARNLLGDAFAGFWISHDPVFEFVVAGVGDHDAAVARMVAGSAWEDITRYESVAYSLAELEAVQGGIGSWASTETNSSIDLPGNRVNVIVRHADRPRFNATARRAVRVIYVDQLAQPSADIYGGLGLSNGCTSGFSVRHRGTGTTGIMTAGHCPDNQSYANTPLPLQMSYARGAVDAQWHTTPGFVDVGKFRANASSVRLVTGMDARSAITIGMTLCKYGVQTGGDCGTVVTKTFKPHDDWGVANPTASYGQLKNCDADMSTPGDSGGPVYHAGRAVGMTTAWYHDIFCATDYNIFSFLQDDTDLLYVEVIKG